MHLDIHYAYMHSKNYEFRNIKTNLEQKKYVIVTTN